MSKKFKRTRTNMPDATRRASQQTLNSGTPLPPHITGATQQNAYSQQQQYAAQQSLQQRPKAGAYTGVPRQVDAQTMANLGVIPSEQYEEIVYNQEVGPYPQQMFAPGAPLTNVPGMETPEGPRQWDYPVGYNIAQMPRSTEISSFDELRLLSMYEGIRLAERVWYDVLNRLILRVTFEPGIVPAGQSDQDPQWKKIIQPVYDFLVYPDRERSINEWLIASATDVLEVGQSAIFINRNRRGSAISLDLIDCATLKPLLSGRGTLPRAPKPAYQQFIKGIPSGLYLAQQRGIPGEIKMQPLTTSNIVMIREMSRTNSPYPRSRVEDVILTINTALRLRSLNLTRYTDGAVPEGFLIPEKDSPLFDDADKTDEAERRLNGALGGNNQQKVRLKLLPPGIAEFIATRPYDANTEFDKWLLNTTAAAFGVTMDELGITETSNRAVGQAQERVTYRRVVQPLANRYAQFFTMVAKQFDERLLVRWDGMEELDDRRAKAEILDICVRAGAISPTDMAREMLLPVKEEVPAYVIAQGGANSIVLLKDIVASSARAQQTADAQLKLQQAQSQMYAKQVEQMNTAPATEETSPTALNETTPEAGIGEEEEGNGNEGTAGEETGTNKGEANQIEKSVDSAINAARQTKGKANTTQRALQPAITVLADPASEADIAEEWRRYRAMALRCVKHGEGVKPFASAILPGDRHAWVADRLQRVATADDVRGVFIAARDHETTCRCMICGCGEPQNDHGMPYPILDPKNAAYENHTGCMVAFFLPTHVSQQLAIPDGCPLSEMHITVAFLGDTKEDDIDKSTLLATVQQWAANWHPIDVVVNALERFPGNPEDGSPIVARSGSSTLHEAHDALVAALLKAGVSVDQKFPEYKPRITLAYIPQDAPSPAIPIPDVRFSLDHVWVAYGDERYAYTLGKADQID